MNDFLSYLLIGILLLIIVSYIVYNVVKIFKASPEEREELVVTYLMGLVTKAEELLGAGHGAEKLAQVEAWFRQNAPWLYKIMLRFSGKKDLKELIEEALKRIKANFQQ